jgi:HSP20 family protein
MTFHSLIPRRSVRRVPAAHPGLRAFWPHDLDRFFDDAFAGFGFGPVAPDERVFAPRVDVSESDEAYTVTADLPGLEEKDIQISLEDGVLTIEGKVESEKDEDRKGLRYAERMRGSFQRALELPGEIDETKVAATYKQGVLTVMLPKQPVPKPEVRTIPITS